MDPANQRSVPRLPAQSSVWLRCQRVAAPAVELANGLLDWSEAGVQFLSRQRLVKGEAVTVTLAGAGAPGTICRRAEVRWWVSLGGAACCAGARFDTPLTPTDVQALLPVELPPADRFVFDDA